MFKRIVLIGMMLGMTTWHGAAQDVRPLDRVAVAFERGDVQMLLDDAASRVEVGIYEESQLYSRAQARFVLQAFFDKHPPERFSLHDTSKTSRGWFGEGRYWFQGKAEPVRVYFRLRKQGTAWELRELLIEYDA